MSDNDLSPSLTLLTRCRFGWLKRYLSSVVHYENIHSPRMVNDFGKTLNGGSKF